MPVFGGGGVSSIALAFTLTYQFDQPIFWFWAGFDSILLGARLWRARIAAATNEVPIGRNVELIELLGAASIGLGSAVAISTGTWIGALLGWIGATAFAGESCVRNLANRRLLTAMLAMGLTPAIVACVATGVPALQLAAALTGLFALRMATGASELNSVLAAAMRAERESDHRARHDRLTGLLNLAGFEREMDLMRGDDPRAELTLFYIDLDNFKRINDTLGHHAGDRLLRRVAEQLLELVGPQDIVARIGGDEFIVVTALDLVEPTEFSAALLAAVKRGELEDYGFAVTASIGVSRSRAHNDLAAIVAQADARLYAAKRSGGDKAMAAD